MLSWGSFKAIYSHTETNVKVSHMSGQQWSRRIERATVMVQELMVFWPALGKPHLIPDTAQSCGFTLLGSHQASQEKLQDAYLKRKRTWGKRKVRKV